MSLYIRFLCLILTHFFRRRLRLSDVSVLKLRVLPNDVDFLRVHGGRYLTFMDLGRVDIILRTGVGRVAVKRRWRPVVSSAMVRHHRSLKLFTRFELHSRILCWDEKWFFFEQRFVQDGQACTVGIVKALLRGPGGNVTPQEVLEAVGETKPSPPPPPFLASYLAADEQL